MESCTASGQRISSFSDELSDADSDPELAELESLFPVDTGSVDAEESEPDALSEIGDDEDEALSSDVTSPHPNNENATKDSNNTLFFFISVPPMK